MMNANVSQQRLECQEISMHYRSLAGLRTCVVTAWIAAAASLTGQTPTSRVDQTPSSRVETFLEGLRFRSIGPATMGGRVDDLAVAEGRPAVFYVGSASGGLWKTVNNGTTWEAVFEHETVASVGAVAVERSDPNVVWVGTGESNNRQSSTWGGGIFKSTDGGRTWKNVGLVDTKHIGRIVIDPVNCDVVYVAAAGHLWGPNSERGIFKTTDGGASWTRALFIDDNTGAADIVMDPSNNKVLYASMYQRQRSPWGYNGGGSGSGLYKSSDAGRTWTRLTSGLPTGLLGRIGLDIYKRDPNLVYAIVQHEQGSGLYRSIDAGAHWTKVNSIDPRPMYFSQIRIDPNDAHRIYVLGVRLFVSDNGGNTFTETRLSHVMSDGERPRDDVDLHAMWIDPADSTHLIVAGDVGLAISYDRGRTFDYIDNLPIGQFYRIGYDMDVPYNVYGGMQDNDVWFGPSSVRNRWGIRNSDWHTLFIGDGFAAFADPRASRTVYAEVTHGRLARVDRNTNEQKTVTPQIGRGEPALRWNWNSPVVLSPHDPNTIFIAANKVFKSTDRGESWVAISPDLTSQVDPDTLTTMGVRVKDIKLSKNDGVPWYPTLVSFAESPKTQGLYYSGSDDGMVHVSRDGGKTWADVSSRFPGLPPRTWVSRVVPSSFDEGTAYVTFNNYRNDDYKPYIYQTADYGTTWKSLASTLPDGQAIDCLAEDTKNPDVLYLGTEFGLFVSIDRGGRWERVKSNLPTVPVDEITIQPRNNDLLLATHGRSIWILDDLTQIQKASEALKSSAYLFDVRNGIAFNASNEYASYPGDRRFWGENLEPGIGISYYLDRPANDVTITVRDGAGVTVRMLSGDTLKADRHAGLNRVYWNLRHQPLSSAPGANVGGSNAIGPFVLPGQYRVTLALEGRDIATRTILVEGDPSIEISNADRKRLHDITLGLHELQRIVSNTAQVVDNVRGQLRNIQQLAQQSASSPKQIKSTADDLEKRVTAVERRLGLSLTGQDTDLGGDPAFDPGAQSLRNQLGTLKEEIFASTSAPTASQTQRARELREDLQNVISELNEIISTALPALNKAALDSHMMPAAIKPIQIP